MGGVRDAGNSKTICSVASFSSLGLCLCARLEKSPLIVNRLVSYLQVGFGVSGEPFESAPSVLFQHGGIRRRMLGF